MSSVENYQFYMEGEKYQADYLKTIKSAKETICLQTYIFKLDGFGTKVYKALLGKAKEGVKVSLTIDDIGSYYFDNNLKKTLIGNNNFEISFFNPLSFPKLLRIGRRLHHKILVVDKKVAFVGGINIAEDFNLRRSKVPRLDFAVKIRNSEVAKLSEYCLHITQILTKETKDKILPKINNSKTGTIVFHYNDWINNRKQITSRYLDLINSSKKSIYLIHGYFFPSFRIMKKLKEQANNGVEIFLILPKYSDWQSWVWASEYLYPKLIKSGIKIREWEPSALHGKLAIFDDKKILVGSYNLNYTSSFGNLEMNIEINSPEFVKKVMDNELKYILKGTNDLSLKTISDLTWPSKVRSFLSYFLLLFIATISINLIKACRLIKNMSYFEIIFLLSLIVIGTVGLLLPLLPGIPFLIAGFLFIMKKRTD